MRIAAVIALAAILPLVISSAARAADVIEVSAQNGYLSDIRGLRIALNSESQGALTEAPPRHAIGTTSSDAIA